jgi:prophage maintenance system killer protein
MARLTAGQARKLILKLKKELEGKGEASKLFGNERGEGLDAVLGSIEQTFGAEPLYPSVEARAAHLLYFVIKDHPFSDGNKRIGSLLFLHYLDKNKRLSGPDGRPNFDDRALVALALLIAESDPQHKELMVRLVLNLLDDAP